MNKEINKIFEYHDLIEAIVSALEMRDSNTAHHSQRVSNMTEALCGFMNLPKEEIELYHIAADLHDIGKIGVSDDLLLKNSRLTDNEWEKMKLHTVIGSGILSKVERFQNIAKIVRHHHERWDGKGYPDMLKGVEIPIGSRIIATVDSIDAMLSHRNYRKALSNGICKQEIINNKGAMYDPKIVDILIENWDIIIKVRENTIHSRFLCK